MLETSRQPRIVGPKDGDILGDPAVATDRFVLSGADTEGRLSIVEHTLAPRVLAAPMHIHTREDEFSYILEGRFAAVLDGQEVYAEAGDFVFKPRGGWHTFWNPGDTSTRILEIITPSGLEELFRQIGSPDFDPEAMGDLAARYGCEADPDRTSAVIEKHGLLF